MSDTNKQNNGNRVTVTGTIDASPLRARIQDDVESIATRAVKDMLEDGMRFRELLDMMNHEHGIWMVKDGRGWAVVGIGGDVIGHELPFSDAAKLALQAVAKKPE